MYERFRHNLRAALRAHPMPLKVIAHRAQYSESHIRKVLSGSKPNPSLKFVDRLAQALGVDPLELLK